MIRHKTNQANTSVDVEHKDDGNEVQNSKYVLGKTNISSSICQPVKQRVYVNKAGRIAETIRRTSEVCKIKGTLQS